MTAPTINIISYTRTRISSHAGVDKSTVIFQADQDLVNWEARAGGNGLGQGLLVGGPTSVLYPSETLYPSVTLYPQAAAIITAGTQVQFDVDYEELTEGDGIYRVNVYGMNEAGEWTAYG